VAREDGDPREEGAARADEVARVQVELATAAAWATPLAELPGTTNDLSRVLPLLEQLAGAVASLLATDLAVVWTTDPHEQLLLPSAWVGFPDDYIAPLRVPYGTGSAGRAVVERRTVLVEDIATSPHYGPFAQGALEHGVRTVLSVPMLTLGGEPMGTLSTYYRTPFAPSDRDLELVDVYARQAAEIVERARLHAEARQLTALEQRRAAQLRALADSALALSAADSLDELLSLVTEAAVEVIGCHQGVTTRLRQGWEDATTYVSLSERYARWRGYDVVPKGQGVLNAVTRENKPLRLTPAQLAQHPEWRGLRDAPGHPPLPDYMAAPLIGRDGSNLGLIQLSHKLDETPFSVEDEAILVQLAQMASSTVERLEALEGERAARREAERAALLRGVLSEASAVFAESFDPKGIGEALVDLVVPRLGRLALLHVLDESGSLELAACAADDPGLQQDLHAFFGAAPVLLDVPYGPAAVLASGAPQVLAATTREMARAVTMTDEQADTLDRLLRRSCACVPLTARGSTLGVLTLSRDEPYDEADVEHLLDLTRRAALALDNATRYAFERGMAVTLQRSLLPRQLAVRSGLSAAARYLPGARGTQVGGDWYDLLEVDGRLVLVVGDVVGRGVEAAALMGQLRATVRAYAIDGHGPAAILSRLDRVVLSLTGLHFTTCVVGVLDQQAGTLCLASAGHLPPVLACPDGGVTVVELDPGLPLGVGGGEFVEQTVDLVPGSLVLLYTDGLVETRECSVDEGLARLVAALAQPISSAEHACDLALGAIDRGGSDDDTAVLALLLDPPEGVTELVVELPAVPASASVARARLRSLLEERGLETDVALLLLTELVGNTARHAGPGEITVRVVLAGTELRVEVADGSGRLPRMPASTPWEQESGRGLLLVEALADRWGSTPTQGGKAVWFELATQPEG
jgi:GAF domain-containing protein/anti-sigma regulatory factor (Ser/Thr protein kinase)